MNKIAREEAKLKGLTRYYPGRACIRGHLCEWMVSGPSCTECGRLSREGRLPPAKIYGVGYNSAKRGTGFLAKTTEGILREYDQWRRMLQRSYDPKWKELHSTYKECSVEEGWWDYQNFARDYYNCQYRPDNSDLDKDLLFMGNKTYGREFCVYLPEDINKTIVIQGKVSHWHKRDEVFEANCNGIYLGRSSDPTAFSAQWIEAKLSRIKCLAEFYKDVIDPRAYNALVNFRVGVDKCGVVYRES